MKATMRNLTLVTMCLISALAAQAGTGKAAHKAPTKKSNPTNEEAHYLKGATPHDFVMPVNPLKPFKSPLV